MIHCEPSVSAGAQLCQLCIYILYISSGKLTLLKPQMEVKKMISPFKRDDFHLPAVSFQGVYVSYQVSTF